MLKDFNPKILPTPKKLHCGEGNLKIGSSGISACRISVPNGASLLLLEAAQKISSKIGGFTGVYPEIVTNDNSNATCLAEITLKAGEPEQCADMAGSEALRNIEGYELKITKTGVSLFSTSEKGVFNGAQTLNQLMYLKNDTLYLPVLEIEDWPNLKHRGLFIEDRYGPDMMTLSDWKDVINYMAEYKMNFLGVGIYGCWCLQYDNLISEFWYLPLKKYPQLKTERIIRYYSSAEGQWKYVKYTPAMFENDFFGEIIKYGKTKNVTVRPHFNSMGHNTLIPRLFPETSAKNEKGEPTGYSYCTSNEHTYEILFGIYDEIIDTYLKPNGIDWFHMGLDEIWEMIGVDPAEPFKVFDPWCKCDKCASRTREEMVTDHIFRLAKHLKSKGINNITMWHDQIFKMGVINDSFVKRVEAEGLKDALILNWWRYGINPLESLLPETGIRRFISPMTGYYHWMLSDSYLINIYKMLEVGHRDEAEGSESYCVFDYSYDRNQLCFSQYSWNNTKVENLDSFRNSYIQHRFAGAEKTAEEAFAHYDRFVEPGDKLRLMMSLTYYQYTYVRKEKPYPRNYPGEVFSMLYSNPDNNIKMLEEIYADSSKAYSLFTALADQVSFDDRLVRHYMAEALSFKVLSNEFLKLARLGLRMKAAGENDKGSVATELYELTTELLAERKKLMLTIEKTKAAYHLPSELRNSSIILQYLTDLNNYAAKLVEGLKNGIALPDSIIDLEDTRNIESELYKLIRYKENSIKM